MAYFIVEMAKDFALILIFMVFWIYLSERICKASIIKPRLDKIDLDISKKEDKDEMS